MRPLYLCLFLSVVIHGLIFSTLPSKPTVRTVRIDKIRLDEKKSLRLAVLSPSRRVSPLPAPSPQPERERPTQRERERPAKQIEQPALSVKERAQTPKPLEEQVESPKPVKTPEGEPVQMPETEAVGLSEPAAEASPLEASEENLFASPPPPLEAGDAPQIASISTPTEKEEERSHPALEGMRDDYLARLREKIEAARRYPDRARRMGQEGRVVVRFIVRASGEIERIDLAESSTFPLLNQAAMEAIRSLSSLPPLPPEFGARMEVTIPLLYRLEQSARR